MTMRILFVDDLPDTCEVFRIALTIKGHSIRLATTGRQAISAVGEEIFDAVVMDIEMPEMNGWQALQQIRGLPNGQSLPVLMFTAYGSNADESEALRQGANGLICKPALPDEVLQRLQTLACG